MFDFSITIATYLRGGCSNNVKYNYLVCNFSINFLDVFAEVPDPGLAAVRSVEGVKGSLGHRHLGAAQPRHLLDLGDEVLGGDGELLLGHVARDVDDLHAVPQRVGDGVQHVGRAQEEHLGQVHRHIQIVIHEAGVLLGVQHLQQRRRGVAL